MNNVNFSVIYADDDICYIDSDSSNNDDDVLRDGERLLLPEPELGLAGAELGLVLEQEALPLEVAPPEAVLQMELEQPLRRAEHTGCCVALHSFLIGGSVDVCSFQIHWLHLIVTVPLIAIIIVASFLLPVYSLTSAGDMVAIFGCMMMFIIGLAAWDAYFSGQYRLYGYFPNHYRL